MPIETLEKTAKLAKLDAPIDPAFDFSGMGTPRAAAAGGEDYAPPDPYAAGRQGAKTN